MCEKFVQFPRQISCHVFLPSKACLALRSLAEFVPNPYLALKLFYSLLSVFSLVCAVHLEDKVYPVQRLPSPYFRIFFDLLPVRAASAARHYFLLFENCYSPWGAVRIFSGELNHLLCQGNQEASASLLLPLNSPSLCFLK